MAIAASPILYLSRRQVERVADMPLAIRAVKAAFKDQASGRSNMPPKVYLDLPDGDFRAMPAALQRPARSGLKWVNVHPQNPKIDLPSVMGLVLLNDPKTGKPLAILEGSVLTQLRTAAAAAVATQTLSLKSVKVAAVIGCGGQALSQIEGLAAVRRIKEVRVWGYAKGEARRFCRKVARRFSSVKLVPHESVQEAVSDAGVVTTITPSRKPLVQMEWISPGTHINAMGADGPGKQELDPRLLKEGRLIVDEKTQAMHGGEINQAVRLGKLAESDIHATLGEVLCGRNRGRGGVGQITVFDSTGLAVHDIALAHSVYRRALTQGIGRHLPV